MSQELSQIIKKWIEITMHKSMHNFFKFSKENDLSIHQIGALIRIYRKRDCNVSILGADMGVSSAAASQMLDRMVQLGLIERTIDPEDRRIKNFKLTEKGLDLINESFHISQSWIEDLVHALRNDEKEETIVVLNRLINLVNLNNGESNFFK
ncbi:MAG: winged helix-turn-helix transcriptional regulator [Candidatus Lokiarchaeota archaeon]|nr:winged helix-turn-helix transcriptional regulator [Candidatus Lokiarchaeota archaeon]